AHPPERRDLIADTVQPRSRVVRPADLLERREAERAEPIIDGDGDDVAPARERGAVVPRDRALTTAEAAAVNPDEDRTPTAIGRRRAAVDRQALLAPLALGISRGPGLPRLRGGGPEGARTAHAAPALVRLRRTKAPPAGRRRRVGNSGEEE